MLASQVLIAALSAGFPLRRTWEATRPDSGSVQGAVADEDLGDASVPQTGDAAWEEEDHCSPPLAMGHTPVLDEHFEQL